MKRVRYSVRPAALCCVLALSATARAQQPGPPPGYYDIPAGFDFPADKQVLEGYRKSVDVPAQRLHVWNVYAGMTRPTPDGKYAIFETWFSEDEVYAANAALRAPGARNIVRRFGPLAQLAPAPAPGRMAVQAAGSALFSEVLYNYAGYNHVRTNRLYLTSELDTLRQTGAVDPAIPNNRIIPAFPATSVQLKTVWWPVAKDQVTPLPVWDPDLNPPLKTGNPFTTWARVVAVDASRTSVPPNATAAVSFLGKDFPDAHLVGIDVFHAVKLDAETVKIAMENSFTAQVAQNLLGRPLKEGDYVVLVATHLTTKEIDDWVWATFWWHDRPDAGPFAADRPDAVTGAWRNYLMSATYDLNLPREADGTPHIAFNPWTEGAFIDSGSGNGIVSNCMNCHNRAAWRDDWNPPGTTPYQHVYRGDPDLQGDPAYAAGRLRTDFLWSVPIGSK